MVVLLTLPFGYFGKVSLLSSLNDSKSFPELTPVLLAQTFSL